MKQLFFKNYNVYPAQEPTYDDYEYINSSFSKSNYIYSLDIWYPPVRKSVSESNLFRDVFISNFYIMPFEYNISQMLLKVHPRMTINITHTPNSKGNWKRSSGAEVEFIPMYRDLIVNYDELLLPGEIQWDYNYLILTHPSYYNYAVELANFLEQERGHHVLIDQINTNMWEDVRDRIYYLYETENHKFVYVLLMGDGQYIPLPGTSAPYQFHVFGDMVYTFMDYNEDPDDWTPEFSIGRLSFIGPGSKGNDAPVTKIIDYYHHWDESRMRRNLLVAGRNFGGYEYLYNEYKNVINKSYKNYSPHFEKRYWDDSDNQSIIDYINTNHPITVNYFGHGLIDKWKWKNFDDYSPENFGFRDIEQVNPDEYRPVIFSIACRTGQFMNISNLGEGEIIGTQTCFCERWVEIDNGAVASIGSTKRTNTDFNRIFDLKIYEAIYDNGYPNLGTILNWAKMDAIKFWYNFYHGESPFWIICIGEAISYILFGDPSLWILPNGPSKGLIENNLSKIKSINEINKAEINIYPNPSYSDFNIHIKNMSGKFELKLFDISGRLIFHNYYDLNSEDNIIEINSSQIGLKTGLYLVNIQNSNYNLYKKVLYIRE